MWCDILQSVYVRSNGEVPCHDDRGEKIQLGHLKGEVDWDIHYILTNNRYKHIFESLEKGNLPWPGICEKCACLRMESIYTDHIKKYRKIEFLQIEPSLYCGLSCPGCTRSTQINQREKPFLMGIHQYEKLLTNLESNCYIINNIEYCGQGEPLTHPNIEQFISIANKIFPGIHQKIITNGNFNYRSKFKREHAKEIVVSCDGYHQKSYEKYRINGNIQKVFTFMRDAKRQLPSSHLVVWKYILFSHNDSKDELLKAQNTAKELNIDCLLFVLTHYPQKMVSKIYSYNNLFELPIIEKNVAFLPTLNILQQGTNLTIERKRYSRIRILIKGLVAKGKYICRIEKRNRKTHLIDCILDNVRIIKNTNSIYMDGWAVDGNLDSLKKINIYIGFRLIGTARMCLFRPDVSKVHGHKNHFSGFMFSKQTKIKESRKRINLKLKLTALNGHKEIHHYTCMNNNVSV